MKRRLTTFLACLFLGVGMAVAQSQVSGTILADDGEPAIGAAVKDASGKTVAVTDASGHFTAHVPAGSKLTVSYMGMKDLAFNAGGNIRLKMEADSKSLSDVLVVGYGTQSKASFTGAASAIKGETVEAMQVSNLSKALEGQVAGVQLASTSGTPGSGASIIIRGIGSLSASTDPLIILDGVPYGGSLNSLNTHDIESLYVLKDAAANSMYGARGANGVIVITTKSGMQGKAKINFDARVGFNARGVGNYDIVTDPGEYYELAYEGYRNQLMGQMGFAEASNYAAQNLISGKLKYNIYKGVADDAVIDPATGRLNPAASQRKWGDNWRKDPFRNGFRQEYNVSVNSGTDLTKVFFSAGYLGDEGYVDNSEFKRYSARVKVDQKIGDIFEAGLNLSYVNTDQDKYTSDEAETGSYYNNLFYFSQSIGPIYPIYLYDADGNPMYDEDGNRRYDFGDEYTRPFSTTSNPYAEAKANINNTQRDNISTLGYFNANITKDLKFSLNVSYDAFNSNSTNFSTPIGGDAQTVGGRSYKSQSRYSDLTAQELLEWNKTFNERHNVHLLGVHENETESTKYLWGHMTGFADYNNPEFANAAQYQGLTSYTYENAREGYLLKGEYGYNETYYFTASMRRDASSRFDKDNRWGTFFALGGAWRVTQEAFMQPLKNTIDNLKLKVSYGTQGNDNISLVHAYTDTYEVNRLDGGSMSFVKNQRGNKDLTWEKQKMFNVGFELGLWNRLDVNFDFFVKNNNDMLFQSPLAASQGTPSYIWRNEVDMRNTGFEVDIQTDLIRKAGLVWTAGLNFMHYKNELTKFPKSKLRADYPDGFQRGSYWWQIGKSIYNFCGYKYRGVDAETGLPLYEQIVTNDDGTKTVNLVNKSSDATMQDLDKSSIPDLTGGFSTSVSYKGFDLSISTAFQLGGWVDDSFYSSLMSMSSVGKGYHKDLFNRWTPTHTSTDIPKLVLEDQNVTIDGNSDYYLTKASYFSLRNVTLGYTLPKSVTSRIGIERLRVYASGDNIWLLSKRKGLDPRQSFSGATGYIYSALSSYSLGINISL